jgi:uncharacterized protein YtpQ (UPF0354 family)
VNWSDRCDRLARMKSLKRLLGKPSQDDFARMVTDAIRGAGNTDSIEYDRESFKLVIGASTQMHLHNAYGDYLKAPRQRRAEVLKRYATGWMARSDIASLEGALPNLLPVVRARSYHGIIQLMSQVRGVKPMDTPMHSLADHLAVSLVVDSPETMSYVVQEHLTTWNLSFEDALERARDNLWNRSGGKFESPIAGVYVSPWHDTYDSSRLFLYDLIWHLEVNGDHVAAIPNRDMLIVTGSEDYGGLAMMAKICEKAQDEPRPQSCIPVILRDKTWVTYRPEPSHPAHVAFSKLRIVEQARDYEQQKELLERLHKMNGEALFVATYSAVRDKETGTYSSYCAWTKGIPILLPEVDSVAFVRGIKPVGSAPWDRVREVAGELIEPLDMYPNRFKVERFPSQEQLAALVGQE